MFEPQFTSDELLKLMKMQQKEIDRLTNGIKEFIDKNFQGGAKSDREDYVQMVTAKDVWNLRELIRK